MKWHKDGNLIAEIIRPKYVEGNHADHTGESRNWVYSNGWDWYEDCHLAILYHDPGISVGDDCHNSIVFLKHAYSEESAKAYVLEHLYFRNIAAQLSLTMKVAKSEAWYYRMPGRGRPGIIKRNAKRRLQALDKRHPGSGLAYYFLTDDDLIDGFTLDLVIAQYDWRTYGDSNIVFYLRDLEKYDGKYPDMLESSRVRAVKSFNHYKQICSAEAHPILKERADYWAHRRLEGIDLSSLSL